MNILDAVAMAQKGYVIRRKKSTLCLRYGKEYHKMYDICNNCPHEFTLHQIEDEWEIVEKTKKGSKK